MKRIRSLIIVIMYLTGHIVCHAQGDFNPPSPVEPGVPTIYSRIVLLRNIDEAGSVSGEGKYVVGNTVNVYAYVNSGYTFLKWTDSKGNELSKATSFRFVNTENTDTLIANYAFTPNNPDEPNDPSTTLYYRLGLKATQGCSISGAGRYLAGKSIYVSAYVESGYSFLGWKNRKGETVSNSTSFYYTMPVDGDTLTACCVFDPNSPIEPNTPIIKHNVSVTCSDGGYFYGNTGHYQEGTSNSLSAYANNGYEFVGWYLNGEPYTNLPSFSYTIGKEDLNFYAKFIFNPDSPSEPSMPALSQYSYYLPTVNGRPGDTIQYAINLVNTELVKDMNIRITFPEGVVIDPRDYILSNKATGYTVTITEAIDTISIIEEGAKLWDFTFIGGVTEPGTQALLTFNVFLPDTIDTGHRHQVKINQISMTTEDGTAVTARTRNGLIGIFKLGDANSDDDINVADLAGVALFMHNRPEENLIRVSADMDSNGIIEEIDYDILVDSVLIQPEQEVPSLVKEKHYTAQQNLSTKQVQTDNILELPLEKRIMIGENKINIPVNLINSQTVTGFQFDLYLQKGIDVSTDENGDFVINIFRTKPDIHIIRMAPLSNGGIRMLCSSKSNAGFNDNSGEILMVTLNIAKDLSEGSYILNMRNIILTDEHANAYHTNDISTTLNIINNDVTVTAKSYTREYGEANPTFEYTIEGSNLEGEPEIRCEATEASPVGNYPIVIEKGSINNIVNTYVNGTLTITQAPLTVKANDTSMEECSELPILTLTYDGWKNGENESVLTEIPKATTIATPQSPIGEYPIIVMGGQALNYYFIYVDGILTVTFSDGVIDTMSYNKEEKAARYDILGRKIDSPQRGFNIIQMKDGSWHKVLIK